MIKITMCPDCSECEGDWHHQMEGVDDQGKPVLGCKHCDFKIPMYPKTTFLETSDGLNRFYFVCEGCGEEGLLGIEQSERNQMSCPSGCGASYIPWTDPRSNAPALMCVVKPVFAKDEDY